MRSCRFLEGCSTFDDVVDIAEGDPALVLTPVDGELDLSTREMIVVACRFAPVLLEISTWSSRDENNWAFNAVAAFASS